jgi:hypothetical protein
MSRQTERFFSNCWSLPALQARPEFVNDWTAKLWSRFFCLSVYITMYLNDHQRSAFYESLGLNTTQVREQGCVSGCGSSSRLSHSSPERHPPPSPHLIMVCLSDHIEAASQGLWCAMLCVASDATPSCQFSSTECFPVLALNCRPLCRPLHSCSSTST